MKGSHRYLFVIKRHLFSKVSFRIFICRKLNILQIFYPYTASQKDPENAGSRSSRSRNSGSRARVSWWSDTATNRKVFVVVIAAVDVILWWSVIFYLISKSWSYRILKRLPIKNSLSIKKWNKKSGIGVIILDTIQNNLLIEAKVVIPTQSYCFGRIWLC